MSLPYVELHKHSYVESDSDYELYRFPTSRGSKPRYERQDRGFDTPCWVWLMYCEPKVGHAYSKVLGTPVHRRLYEEFVRKVPTGLILHHRCEVPACVNPAHLQEMTHAEHNRLHKTGKKMNLSDEELERRRNHGREIASKLGGQYLYTKQSRSDVSKRVWDSASQEQREARARKVSEARQKNAPTHCPYGHPYSGENLYVSPRGQRACRACTKRRLAESRARRGK